MRIPLKEISTEGLLNLLQDVAAEVSARLSTPIEQRVVAVESVVVVREPTAGQKEVCLQVAQALRSGGYITADERRQVAAVANEFPQWVRLQGLPLDSGTGSWRKAAEKYRIGSAKER